MPACNAATSGFKALPNGNQTGAAGILKRVVEAAMLCMRLRDVVGISIRKD
jgi:hypothetical protein